MGKYKVAFALLDASGKPVKLFYDEEAQPHEWIKGSPKQYSFTVKADGIAPGDYTWAVGIVDYASETKKIGIFTSAKGNYTSDGWLKLSKVTLKQ